MESPFLNDMYAMVYQAFKKLYPDKECQCQWQPEKMTAEDGKEVLGLTTWTMMDLHTLIFLQS